MPKAERDSVQASINNGSSTNFPKSQQQKQGDLPIFSVNQVLNAVCQADTSTPLLIAFDETLFLQNSTEAYLRTVKPRFLAIFILSVLDYTKPWKFFGPTWEKAIRNWTRVFLITVLFPWSYWLWRRQAAQLVQQFENIELSAALADNPQRSVTIVSNGFDFIIRPILEHMSVSWDQLITYQIWDRLNDRIQGKKGLVEQIVGTEYVKSSLLITDSLDDKNLLDSVRFPYVVKWNIPAPKPTLSPGYFPFVYMENIKKRNQNFFVHEIFIEGLIFLFLLLAWTQPHPFIHTAGLTCLWLSFWCIYEIGYMENDVVAANYECNPTLADDYDSHKDRINFYQPWVWSFILAIPGLLLLQLSYQFEYPFITWLGSSEQLNQLASQMGLWIVFLLMTRIIYCIYNYIDEQSRVWLYPVLQALKFVGFFMYTAVNPLAWVYFLSLINSRWIPYIVYRYGNLRSFPKGFPMLFMHWFGMFVVILPTFLSDSSQFVPLQLFLVTLIVTFRAKREAVMLVRRASLLAQEVNQGFLMKNFASRLFPKP